MCVCVCGNISGMFNSVSTVIRAGMFNSVSTVIRETTIVPKPIRQSLSISSGATVLKASAQVLVNTLR